MLSFKKAGEGPSLGLSIVRYRTGSSRGSFEINATKQGICLIGDCPIISTQDELEVLAEHIAKAWKHYQVMKGNGHNGSETKLSVESDQ